MAEDDAAAVAGVQRNGGGGAWAGTGMKGNGGCADHDDPRRPGVSLDLTDPPTSHWVVDVDDGEEGNRGGTPPVDGITGGGGGAPELASTGPGRPGLDRCGVGDGAVTMFDDAVVTCGLLPLVRGVLGVERRNTAADRDYEGCEGVDDDDDDVRLSTDVPHLRQSDGWSCGYRNLQALLCHLLRLPSCGRCGSAIRLGGDDADDGADEDDESARPASPFRGGVDDIGGGVNLAEDGIRRDLVAEEAGGITKVEEDKPPAAPSPPPPLPKRLPTVLALQRLLERAWAGGYDPDGAAHYGSRLANTTQRIGAVEASSLLRYVGVDATVVQFVKTTEGRAVLAPFVWNHFATGLPSSSLSSSDDRRGGGAAGGGDGCGCGCGKGSDVERGAGDEDCNGEGDDDDDCDLSAWELLRLTQRVGAVVDDVPPADHPGENYCHDRRHGRRCGPPPPLYLQWAGHSVTVVGIVRRRRRRRRGPPLQTRTPSGNWALAGDDAVDPPRGGEGGGVGVDFDFDFDLLVFDPLRDCSGLKSRLSAALPTTTSKDNTVEDDVEKTEEGSAVPQRSWSSAAGSLQSGAPSSDGATTTGDLGAAASVAPIMMGCDDDEEVRSLLAPLRLPAGSLLRRDCQIVYCRRRGRRCVSCRCRKSPSSSSWDDGGGAGSSSSPPPSPTQSQPPTRKRKKRQSEKKHKEKRLSSSSSSSFPPATSPPCSDGSKHGGGCGECEDDCDEDDEEGGSGSGSIIKGVRSVTATGMLKRTS